MRWITRKISWTKSGRQAHGGFIQEQQPGPAHQGPAHRQHLLLAAGQRIAPLPPPLRQPGEQLEDLLQIMLNLAVPAPVSRQAQIFQDRQVAEDAPALRDVGDAPGHPEVRRHPQEVEAFQGHPASGHRQHP